MKECPNCGYDAYVYRVWNAVLEYSGIFGKGLRGEECVVSERGLSSQPTYAFCVKCNHRIKLEEARA